MDGLLTAMNDLYTFVAAADLLKDVDKDRKKLLKDMFVQTAECAYFIRDKAQVESFCEYIIFYVADALALEQNPLQGLELGKMRSSAARSTVRSASSHKHSSTSAVSSPSEGCSQSRSSSPSLMTFVRLRCSPNTSVLTVLSRHDRRLAGPCSRPRRRARLEQGLSRGHASADTGRAHYLDQRPRCP